MVRPFKILSEAEQIAFDSPPNFDSKTRKQYFYISSALETLLRRKVRTNINKIMFVVAFGYFKACKQFYKESRQKDLEYVARQLDLNPDKISSSYYSYDSIIEHQKLILEYFGFSAFNSKAKKFIHKEVQLSTRSQIRPSILVRQVVELLIKNNIQVPGYQKLANIISEEFNVHQSTLIELINNHLKTSDKKILQDLFNTSETSSEVARYRLTLLKHFSQSVRPQKIQKNVEDLLVLRDLYRIAKPILKQLDLNKEGVRQYANAVIKSRIFQVSRRREPDRFLHLIAFIAHQYFRLQDLLVDVLLTSVTSAVNSSEKEFKETYYRTRKDRATNVNKIAIHFDNFLSTRKKCIRILVNAKFDSDQKVEKLSTLLGLSDDKIEDIKTTLTSVRADNLLTLSEQGLLNIVELKSRKLQNRVSDIIKNLTFSSVTTNNEILMAIHNYQQTDGKISESSPITFMTQKQQEQIKNKDGKLRVSLYKALLFLHTAKAIEAGAINIENSYKYRSLEDYLIPKQLWIQNKETYLIQSNMMRYADINETLKSLQLELERKFYETNIHIMNNENAFVRPNGNGGYRMSNAKHEIKEEDAPIQDLFPRNECISLSEVLSTVENPTDFLNAFEHWQPKYSKAKPANRIFYAGIIGYGCQIGTQKIAKISKKINASSLESAVNWYFSIDNLQKASDRIIEFVNKMDLPYVYQDNRDILHTSSDGQKYNVSEDSLNASYSYKYHGKSKGISEYTFIDAQHRFFHSNVISSAEKEAHFVLDGLMHNDVVKSDIHSTDSHGYSETVFAVSFLLGFTFAPRIKNVYRQFLYAFNTKGVYKKKDYPILPDKRIRESLIVKHWDDILRFVTTIQLKETTASQLFRRLNSYSKDNPLYLALKEFGRIIKTIFILTYIDDPEFRETIQKQLNKGESGNKLARALNVGNPEFAQATKEDQEIAESCKRLIKNAIVCWNYMFLTQELANEKNPTKKEQLLLDIKRGSVVSWNHLNLHGEFDFSDDKLKDSVGLKISQILKERLPQNSGV